MDDDVVHKRALPGQQGGVLRLADSQAGSVVAGNLLHQLQCLGALDVDFPHVAHVEESRSLPDGEVFGDDAAVLDRHLPPGEVHHLAPERPVGGMQGSLTRNCLGFHEWMKAPLPDEKLKVA